MKYWWLEKYQNFKIVQMKQLSEEVAYFLTMPKNYQEKVKELQKRDISTLEEEDCLILFYHIVETKNVKDKTLLLLISKLLTYQDNSFPSSDYTLLEMLQEIQNLKENPPLQEKMDHNNIAICYHCGQIFYVDKIHQVNSKHYCLCPYCASSKLYFDNDYIPMNYAFLKLAYLYYHLSKLGCSFSDIQKLLQKNLHLEVGKQVTNSICLTDLFPNQPITPLEEKKLYRTFFLKWIESEKTFLESKNIFVPSISNFKENIYLLFLISIMEALATTVYLKKFQIIFERKEDQKLFSGLVKTMKTFH